MSRSSAVPGINVISSSSSSSGSTIAPAVDPASLSNQIRDATILYRPVVILTEPPHPAQEQIDK